MLLLVSRRGATDRGGLPVSNCCVILPYQLDGLYAPHSPNLPMISHTLAAAPIRSPGFCTLEVMAFCTNRNPVHVPLVRQKSGRGVVARPFRVLPQCWTLGMTIKMPQLVAPECDRSLLHLVPAQALSKHNLVTGDSWYFPLHTMIN